MSDQAVVMSEPRPVRLPIDGRRVPQDEASFQQAIVDLALIAGWRVYHQRPGMNRSGKWASAIIGHTGWPDLVLGKMGRKGVLFREVKTEKGALTTNQKMWGEVLLSAGEDWAVWRPSDWDEIVYTLTAKQPKEMP